MYKKLKEFGIVKTNVFLSKYTTFKIGGPAQFLVEILDTKKLVEVLNFLSGEGIEYFILGGGSNVLWKDEEFEGVVVRIMNRELRIMDNGIIEAGAGTPLAVVVNTAVQNNLSGLEWAAGVPGTVGGAVRGNAGAMDSDTARSLVKIEVWRDGEVLELNIEECEFGYRDSVLKHNSDVVLRAWYKTVPGDKLVMMQKIQGYVKQRNGHYPAFPSAGSFFKNVDIIAWPGKKEDLPEVFQKNGKIPAGWLNEQVGLKGFSMGGGKLSNEHGNFLINFDNATQSDMLKIVEEIQKKVSEKFGVELEPEVKIIH